MQIIRLYVKIVSLFFSLLVLFSLHFVGFVADSLEYCADQNSSQLRLHGIRLHRCIKVIIIIRISGYTVYLLLLSIEFKWGGGDLV